MGYSNLNFEMFVNIISIVLIYGFFVLLSKFILFAIPKPFEYINVGDEKERTYRIRRWKNIIVSFVHACIAGITTLVTLIKKPEILDDLVDTHDPVVIFLSCFVFTYFLYDTVDNLTTDHTRRTYEMLIHHLTIVVSYSVVIVLQRWYGNCFIIILLEVNSIFLHLRHILLHYNVSRKNTFFRINAFINVVTFFIFRICVCLWMYKWIYYNHHLLPFMIKCLALLVLTIFIVINSILLCRLINSDYISEKKDHLS